MGEVLKYSKGRASVLAYSRLIARLEASRIWAPIPEVFIRHRPIVIVLSSPLQGILEWLLHRAMVAFAAHQMLGFVWWLAGKHNLIM